MSVQPNDVYEERYSSGFYWAIATLLARDGKQIIHRCFFGHDYDSPDDMDWRGPQYSYRFTNNPDQEFFARLVGQVVEYNANNGVIVVGPPTQAGAELEYIYRRQVKTLQISLGTEMLYMSVRAGDDEPDQWEIVDCVRHQDLQIKLTLNLDLLDEIYGITRMADEEEVVQPEEYSQSLGPGSLIMAVVSPRMTVDVEKATKKREIMVKGIQILRDISRGE